VARYATLLLGTFFSTLLLDICLPFDDVLHPLIRRLCIQGVLKLCRSFLFPQSIDSFYLRRAISLSLFDDCHLFNDLIRMLKHTVSTFVAPLLLW